MKHLPKGVTKYDQYTDARLIAAAQSLHDGMVAEAITFPTPPITVIIFQGFIDAYQTACASAWKGDKNQTNDKAAAKKVLIDNMRSMVTYVNQVVYDTYNTTPSSNYATLRALILSAGVQVQKTTARPNTLGNVKPVNVRQSVAKHYGNRKYGNNINGVLYIRIPIPTKFRVQSFKTYWLQYRTAAKGTTPAGPWITYQSTSLKIQVSAAPGVYDYQYAAVAGVSRGLNQLNWSNIQQAIVT